MPLKDPRLYLIHIEECCSKILEYTAELGAEWPTSPLVVDAVCRNIEIIGEAANRLDAEYRSAHPDVPWRSLINTRNLLIHAYDQVNAAVLGGIVERDVPALAEAVRRLLRAPRELP